MKTKFYVIGAAIVVFFLAGGFYVQNTILLADEKPKSTECPFLQYDENVSCPYLEGNAYNSDSDCPYLNGEMNSSKSGEETETESKACPYSKENGSVKKIYKRIKNTST